MEVQPTTENNSTNQSKFANSIPKLVNILYPGNVKNVDKAIETLGGMRNIESATTGEKKHLELSFKPNCLTTKPVLADRDTKPQLLLKVKTKKCIENGKIVSKEVLDYNVVGLTAVTLKFTRLCDFQYLPLVSEVPKEVEDELIYVYDDIIPKKLPNADWLNNEELGTMPVFFVPYQFSKFNTHGNQLQFERSQFYEDCLMPQYCDKFKETQRQQKTTRKQTFTKSAMLIRIEDDIPQGPTPQALTLLKQKGFTPEIHGKCVELFEGRPIWSRNALVHHSRATNEQMKFILPTVAFHYVSGPWRVMWVRFGYDPRVDSSAKLLQTFDYRIRSRHIHKIKLKSKPAAQSTFSLSNAATPGRLKLVVEENAFILRPGLIPAARQTFYQYCDVKLQDIENMLAKLPAIHPGETCDWKRGWLPNGFADQCREVVNRYVTGEISGELTGKEKGNVKQESSGSTSDSTSSDSDISEGDDGEEGKELDDVIDLEVVEEINQLLAQTSASFPKDGMLGPQAGPSSAK